MKKILIVNQGWEEGTEEAFSMKDQIEKVTDAKLIFVAEPEQATNMMLNHQLDAVLMGGMFSDFPVKYRAGAMMVAYVRKFRSIPICMISSDEQMNKDGLTCGANAVWSKHQMRRGEYIPLISFLRLARIPVKT